MNVFVLLFNVDTANEGVHAERLPSGEAVVLGFADQEDATRYVVLLEAQDFAVPSVVAMERGEVEDLCREYGYVFKLIPAGELTVPPEANLSDPALSSGQKSEEADLSVPMVDNLEEFRRRLERLME